MAVSSVVVVLNPDEQVTEASNKATAITIVRTTNAPINTTTGEAVVDVVGPVLALNAFVSPVTPTSPYDGMIWIDTS